MHVIAPHTRSQHYSPAAPLFSKLDITTQVSSTSRQTYTHPLLPDTMAPTTSRTATDSNSSTEMKDWRARDRAGQRLHRKQHHDYKDEPMHPRIRSSGRPTDLAADLKDTDTPSWMDQDALVLGWDTVLLPLDEDLGGECYEWDDPIGFSEISLGDIMRTEGCRIRSARRKYHRKGVVDSFEVVPKVPEVIALEDSEPSLRTVDKLEIWDLVEGDESADSEEGRNLTYAQVVTG